MNKPAPTCLLLGLLTTTAFFSLRCDDAESSDDTVNSLAVASSAVSECGGFGASDMALTDEGALLEYCDAEILTWSYDKETAVLSLLNTRVMLNCCGNHGFTTELTADGVYVVTETDRPMKKLQKAAMIAVIACAPSTTKLNSRIFLLYRYHSRCFEPWKKRWKFRRYGKAAWICLHRALTTPLLQTKRMHPSDVRRHPRNDPVPFTPRFFQ